MSWYWTLAAYGSALVAPLVLLRHFRAQAWYWHTLSICAALALALTPISSEWRSPGIDLMNGSAILFLLVWGASAPLFRVHRTSSLPDELHPGSAPQR